MTTQEAAARIGIDDSLVRRYCRDGRIEATKHGHGWWITATALRKFRRRPRLRGNPGH